MAVRHRTGRFVAGFAALAVALAGCGGGDGGDSGPPEPGADEAAIDGGTLEFLTVQDQFQHLDPQRNYTGEDLAFASGYLQRTLTAYRFSPDGEEATELVPDLATDTGTPSDGARTWTFTLKDGVMFEDGTPITCEDIKYGVSRTFATGIITDGPTYAISMLDIPKEEDGSSVYEGPYETEDNNVAAFDKAVECPDDQTIVFHLNRPVGDFNYTVTLLAFSPVPKAADTGESYDDNIVASGPYRIETYDKGNRLVLVRNENWDPATDDYRGAHPDRIVVNFAVESSIIDQRMIQDSGADQRPLPLGDSLQPQSLPTVFGSERFADRRVNDLDPYVRYIAINTQKVPNLEHRKAIAVALDREQLRTIQGGEFAGDLADGVIKPNLPLDYAPSGMWTGLLGVEVPDGGDPEAAMEIIEASGEPMPRLTYDYPQTPTNDKAAAALQASLAKADIRVRLNGIEPGQYYGIVLNPERQGHLASAGWGPDWSNASTIIPELFTPSGGFNLSRADDEEFTAKSDEAQAMTDREAQAEMWQELNKQAMANVWVVPTRFGREQRLAGSKVGAASADDGNVYLWAPFGSWPYGDLYVEQ